MSIASAISTKQTQVAACYTACNNKGATMPAAANQNLSHLANTIGTISAGGGIVEAKDVNFRDYDGTLVASYTATEFASLSALPANPSHTGLTAQGWNWTLSDAKTYVAAYGRLEVGQMYITSDGKTRLYIRIYDSARMDVPLYWQQTVANGITIDWGDGSATETFTGTGSKNTTHSYNAPGNYVILFTVNSGTLELGYSGYSVMGTTTDSESAHNTAYRNMLQRAEIGDDVARIPVYSFSYCFSLTSVTIPSDVTSIGNYAFCNCYSLTHITIPNTVTSTSVGAGLFQHSYALASASLPKECTVFGNQMFYDCYSLASVTFSSGVTTIGTNTFWYCYSLASVTIPSGVTTLGNRAFQSCYSLTSITIPSTVTSIGDSAINGCYSISSVIVLASAPPTLGTNVFNNSASDLVIYVPSASVDTYKAAEGWSAYADKIQAIPE